MPPTGAFRAGRSPAEVQLFNDIGWIIMVVPTVPFIIQVVSIAVVILSDGRSRCYRDGSATSTCGAHSW
ncbi:MAG: hypothetical protein ACYDHH_25590 [Solirubrobacteraceae bacterium]